MAQGALPFQYEAETATSGVTALGGLPVYLDLIKASGLDVAIRKHVDDDETERLQAQIDSVKALYGIREQRLENLLA